MSSSQPDIWQNMFEDETQDTICDLYDNLATGFDKMISSLQYERYEIILTAMNELIKDKSSRIIDFAACTGLFGVEMHKNGYTNIDALDGSAKCIEECEKRNVYKNVIVEFVEDKKPLNIATDSYDVIICIGGFTRNHLPISVLSEFIRILKPGGYIINSFRYKWLTEEPMYNEGKFEAELEKLEKEGKWKFVSKLLTDTKNYDWRLVQYIHKIL